MRNYSACYWKKIKDMKIQSKLLNSNNIRVGALLSYILVIINAVYGLAITPFIIGKLGTAEYGVYKTIAALSSSLMVLDLGLGGTVTRYVSTYIAEKNNIKIEKFVSMAIGEGSILIIIISAVCAVLYFLLPMIYAKGLDADQIILAQKLFIILSVNICCHIAENLLNGIISGFNRFVFANSLKLIRVVVRIILTIVVLTIYRSAFTLVILDLLLTIFLMISEYSYIRRNLKITVRISFRGWDRAVFAESFRYTGLLFLTSIAAQVNSNLDNVVIGAEQGADFVTVYSMGLVVFAMFENLSTAISGVMLPTVTNALVEDVTGLKVKEIVISAGRIQFMILGAAFVGFIVLGKTFVNLWLGEEYQDVYIIVLILIAPSLLELCVNICLSILRAKNILGFRTVILSGCTAFNAIITVIGVKLYGYFAAAIGTGVSFLLGSVVIMNIYYYRKLRFNMIEIYRRIFERVWLCIIVAGFTTWIASQYIGGTWVTFIFDVLIFGVIYLSTLFFWGFNSSEKNKIKNIISRRNK